MKRTSRLIPVLIVAGVFIALVWKLTRLNAPAEPIGTYFRLQVALTYKNQPVGFDIVVGCNVKLGRDSSGGGTAATMGMVGFVYAKAIPDGHAVSVLTVPPSGSPVSDPCLGATTSNGDIPKDWLPIVVWYDRAEDLSHGMGYATQDAYLGPNSRLSFGGATVERATKADFEAFLARGPANLIPPYLATNLYGGPAVRSIRGPEDITPEIAANPWKAWRLTPWLSCNGTIRVRVPETLRDEVRRAWPADRPELWPAGREFISAWRTWIAKADLANGKVGFYRAEARATNDGAAIVFPSFPNFMLSKISPTSLKDGHFFDDTDLEDLNRYPGMVFCDRETPRALVRHLIGTIPVGERFACLINGQTLGTDYACESQIGIAVVRDEYLLVRLVPFAD